MYIEIIFFSLISINLIFFVLIFNRLNISFILILLYLELILIFFSFIFIIFTLVYQTWFGLFLSLIILTLAAAESVLGLTILLILYKIRNFNFELKNLRW